MMTPLSIIILLHYHCYPADYNDGNFTAPAVSQHISRLLSEGMLTYTGDMHPKAIARLTTKGTRYVNMLLSIPYPNQAWVFPGGLEDAVADAQAVGQQDMDHDHHGPMPREPRTNPLPGAMDRANPPTPPGAPAEGCALPGNMGEATPVPLEPPSAPHIITEEPGPLTKLVRDPVGVVARLQNPRRVFHINKRDVCWIWHTPGCTCSG
jgi:hypothetical protein